MLRELSAGDVNILLARADFDQALRLLRRLELRLRHAQGGLAQVVILPGNASRANQLLGAGPVCLGTGQRRLPVGSLGPGLGDFLRPRAMLQSRQVGGRVVPPGTGGLQLIVEIALVEAGHDLPGCHRVSLVHREGFDPSLNLEGQIHLPDIDVALENER